MVPGFVLVSPTLQIMWFSSYYISSPQGREEGPDGYNASSGLQFCGASTVSSTAGRIVVETMLWVKTSNCRPGVEGLGTVKLWLPPTEERGGPMTCNKLAEAGPTFRSGDLGKFSLH